MDDPEKDPEKGNPFNWGDTQIGGTYTETVTGLHKKTIYAKGIFRFYRNNYLDILNGDSNYAATICP